MSSILVLLSEAVYVQYLSPVIRGSVYVQYLSPVIRGSVYVLVQ